MLRLTLFGEFSAAGADGTDIAIKSKKAKALLAYLALSPRKSRSREEIMALLWSDRGEAQARASLRQVLVGLRKDLGEKAVGALIAANDAIALDPNKVTVEAPNLGEELLAGFHLHDPAFEEWLRDERLRYEDTAVVPDTQIPGLPLPDYPSIAVLPFTNMSGDPGQELFSDGIAEDIITALSKIPSLLVISRNSTFTYKGQAVDAKRVSREQGVRYVLEGSVRKAGNRVRVTTQLVDATTGLQLWAERYDRDLEDIFAVQDEITREVVVALDIRLSGGEQARFWSSGTTNLEAWQCVRLATDLLSSAMPEAVGESKRLCERALDLDPSYAMAWADLGWAHHNEADVGLVHSNKEMRDAALGSAMDCGKRALELDPLCADAHALLGMCHLSKDEHEQAIAMSEKAVELAPNHAENVAISAVIQSKSGRPQRALDLIGKALRLCPIYPSWFLWVLGTASRLTGQLDAAIEAFEIAIERSPDFLGLRVGLASTLGELGRQEDAKRCISEILRLDPNFSIAAYMGGLSYKNPEDRVRFEDGLRKAGLPE
jgi:adenylate cyclase